jgi:hypothetical protein
MTTIEQSVQANVSWDTQRLLDRLTRAAHDAASLGEYLSTLARTSLHPEVNVTLHATLDEFRNLPADVWENWIEWHALARNEWSVHYGACKRMRPGLIEPRFGLTVWYDRVGKLGDELGWEAP